MSVDRWLGKRRSRAYNCAAFAADVLECPPETIAGVLSARKDWRRLLVPESPCLALLRRNAAPPHVGIYINGGVLHLGDKIAMFQPLCVIERDYNKINFYANRNHNN